MPDLGAGLQVFGNIMQQRNLQAEQLRNLKLKFAEMKMNQENRLRGEAFQREQFEEGKRQFGIQEQRYGKDAEERAKENRFQRLSFPLKTFEQSWLTPEEAKPYEEFPELGVRPVYTPESKLKTPFGEFPTPRMKTDIYETRKPLTQMKEEGVQGRFETGIDFKRDIEGAKLSQKEREFQARQPLLQSQIEVNQARRDKYNTEIQQLLKGSGVGATAEKQIEFSRGQKLYADDLRKVLSDKSNNLRYNPDTKLIEPIDENEPANWDSLPNLRDYIGTLKSEVPIPEYVNPAQVGMTGSERTQGKTYLPSAPPVSKKELPLSKTPSPDRIQKLQGFSHAKIVRYNKIKTVAKTREDLDHAIDMLEQEND